MDRFFHVTEKGSTIRTEIMAGITTFMAMAYILMVNAGMFSNPFGDGTDVLGVSYGAIYVATAISAVVGTLLIGLLSNLPLAQASGMGLNAYFVYTVCVGLGLSYANALVLVLFDGIIFVLLTVTGLRKIIFDSIPHEVKVAISAGNDKVDYAKVHNEGFTSRVTVPAHVRHTSKYGNVEVREHTRQANIPARPFMGRSDELAEEIHKRLEGYIDTLK